MSLLLLLLLCDDAEPTYAHTHVTPSCRKLIRLRTGYCTVWQRCYVAVVVPSFVLFVLAAFITPLLTSLFFASSRVAQTAAAAAATTTTTTTAAEVRRGVCGGVLRMRARG